MATDQIELAEVKQGESVDPQPLLNNARENVAEGNPKVTTLTFKNELGAEMESEKPEKEEVDATKVQKDHEEDGPKKSEVQARPDDKDKYPEQNSSAKEGDTGRQAVTAAVVEIEKVPEPKPEDNASKLPENVKVAPPEEEECGCLLDSLSFLMGLCDCVII